MFNVQVQKKSDLGYQKVLLGFSSFFDWSAAIRKYKIAIDWLSVLPN
jgi:hypothetical protein